MSRSFQSSFDHSRPSRNRTLFDGLTFYVQQILVNKAYRPFELDALREIKESIKHSILEHGGRLSNSPADPHVSHIILLSTRSWPKDYVLNLQRSNSTTYEPAWLDRNGWATYNLVANFGGIINASGEEVWSRHKVVLGKEWIMDCVARNRVLEERSNWGGWRIRGRYTDDSSSTIRPPDFSPAWFSRLDRRSYNPAPDTEGPATTWAERFPSGCEDGSLYRYLPIVTETSNSVASVKDQVPANGSSTRRTLPSTSTVHTSSNSVTDTLNTTVQEPPVRSSTNDRLISPPYSSEGNIIPHPAQQDDEPSSFSVGSCQLSLSDKESRARSPLFTPAPSPDETSNIGVEVSGNDSDLDCLNSDDEAEGHDESAMESDRDADTLDGPSSTVVLTPKRKEHTLDLSLNLGYHQSPVQDHLPPTPVSASPFSARPSITHHAFPFPQRSVSQPTASIIQEYRRVQRENLSPITKKRSTSMPDKSTKRMKPNQSQAFGIIARQFVAHPEAPQSLLWAELETKYDGRKASGWASLFQRHRTSIEKIQLDIIRNIS
ncbi:uncharacterized protein IL334_006930 [Kwoniella shivajii]|uniref:BRCT domain-containing protein n=1 Tax=Kwoniella shivajii TaxID=564305 RepID=A0ABZ1D7B8_9TREE|nr:hypothetical protein IL334_006930 [Kwoniella shivajii]